MKLLRWFLIPLALIAVTEASAGEEGGGETLDYSVNWPSGLSLGEARMTSRVVNAPGGGNRLEFEFSLEAAVPGFAVQDRYRSQAAGAYCSTLLEKEAAHGKKITKERVRIDPQSGLVKRETLVDGGGKSEYPAPPCVKDALTFLHFLRQELAQGRLPPSQMVVFGAPYQISIEYGGAVRLVREGAPVDADRLKATLKGPDSSRSFEMVFARDAVRTPLIIRVPLELGAFSLELLP